MGKLWTILFLLLAFLLCVSWIALHGQAGTPYDRVHP
jgi:hypothetical protein